MADKIDIAEKEDGVRNRGLLSWRRAARKIPLLGSQEGNIHVMENLDETGGDQYKPRIRKYPGFSVLESFLKTDRTKDGRKVEYSDFQMLQRAATSGAYNAQRFLHWLGKKREGPSLIADRQNEVELPPALREAHESKDDEAQVLNSTGRNVVGPRGNHGIRFGIHPYENVFDLVVAPRLIVDRSGEFILKNGAAKGAVVPALRLLTNQGEGVITNDNSDVKQVAGPNVVGLLPPPKPPKPAERVSASGRAFKLVGIGRTAARKEAFEKGRDNAAKNAKNADKER